MAMIRRGIRRVMPKRDNWHSLQEYAVGEANNAEFQSLRGRDSAVAGLISSQGKPATAVDWSSWESRINNKEVFQCLKDFHAQQSALLDGVLGEDHASSVKNQTAGWELFDSAVKSCEKSVEKSETIMRNGARALWISYQNPPINQIGQNEWLDADQYWQAFIEKHQYYHDHLDSAVEDPESKDYETKCKNEIIGKYHEWDGMLAKNENTNQKCTHEYYTFFRGQLVEHMIYYLTKTGGDARFFPQIMPVEWHVDIYNQRFDIYNVLHRRKAEAHNAAMTRTFPTEFIPSDLAHDGEGYYAKLVAKESAITELTVARLMGNFIFLTDSHVPVQTGAAFYKALQMDGGKGTFYSLGADVHCLFYKPAQDLTMPDPKECFHALADHVSMTGRRFEVGYAAALEAFCNVLESRKEGLAGHWLTIPGESTKDAFMRRVKRNDPAFDVFEAYAEEHTEKWAEARALSLDEAMKEMPEIERKYNLECTEYDNVLFGISDELTPGAKLEMEQLTKLAEAGELQGLLDSGDLVAVQDGAVVNSVDAVTASIADFDSSRDKAVESIMAAKSAIDKKK